MTAARPHSALRTVRSAGLFALGAILLVTGLGAAQPVRPVDGGDAVLTVAQEPSGLNKPTAGGEHSCGIKGGRLYCWGRNTWGQVGDGTRGGTVASPQRIGTASDWRRVEAGGASTCGIRGDRRVLRCWGLNHRGQLGDGTRDFRLRPTRVRGENWRQVDVGWFTTCAVKQNRRAFCWGGNANGQLGKGDTRQTLQYHRLPGRWRDISVEGSTVCGVTKRRALYCWGRNLLGQVGDGTRNDRHRPVRIAGPRWREVEVSWTHGCARRGSGLVRCWGNNDRGQVGDGTTRRRTRPTAVAGSLRARSLAVSEGGSCLVDRSERLFCWGDNKYGQIGGGDTALRTPSPRGGSYRNVSSGWLHSCAKVIGGGTRCWGNNERGQLARPASRTPMQDDTSGPPPQDGALRFTLASYNVLGEHHTGAYRHEDRFAPGRLRAEWTAQVFRTHGLDVIGLQEPSKGQVRAILDAGGGRYDAFPHPDRHRKSTETTLVWDQRKLEAVTTRTIRTQFIARKLPRPVVKFRDRATGRAFWVMNVHNAPWDYQQQRDQATAVQIAELQRLEETGLPVYFVGDMNEKRRILCKVLRRTDLDSPIGGRLRADGRCVTPRVMRVDWLFGSDRSDWGNFHFAKPPLIRLTTDHWVPMTKVRVP